MKDLSAKIFLKDHPLSNEILEPSREEYIKNSLEISVNTYKKSQDSTELTGWWADSLTPGREIGSDLHLLQKKPYCDDTLDEITSSAYDALKWLEDENENAKLRIDAEKDGGSIFLNVTFSKEETKKIKVKS